MSAAFRDAEAGLRHARAETAFHSAALAIREWCVDMWAPEVPIFEAAAMPPMPAIRELVDPLADSALAAASITSTAGNAISPERKGTSERMHSSIRQRKPSTRGWTRWAIAGDSATAATSRLGALSRPAEASRRVASLFARHDHLRVRLSDSAFARSLNDAARPLERKVVPLPLRRSDFEARPPGATIRTPPAPASTIARWQALSADSARGLGATDAGVDAVERAQVPPQMREEPYVLELPLPLSQAPVEHASFAVDRRQFDEQPSTTGLPARQDEILRLHDLATALASTTPENEAPRVVAPASAKPPTADHAGIGSLGRVFDSLARIEQQIAARGAQAGHAETATRWYEDDDGLAGRIHDILRRQVERHGIDLP